jgi:hypothetical protein
MTIQQKTLVIGGIALGGIAGGVGSLAIQLDWPYIAGYLPALLIAVGLANGMMWAIVRSLDEDARR